MKNILLSVVVVATLIGAGIGGTFAGFVDTEVSRDNYLEAGILDLLVSIPPNMHVELNDDPTTDTVGAAISVDNFDPAKGSVDFYIDAYSRSTIDGFLYMHFKDVDSVEAGMKDGLVYERSSNSYVVGTPVGPDFATSEPEWIAEHGGQVGQIIVGDPDIMGEDYASGVAANLGIVTEVPLEGQSGNVLGNPDTNGDDQVSATERAAWITNDNRWVIILSLTGLLGVIESNNDFLGTLKPQTKTFIHISLSMPQLLGPELDYDADGDIDDDDAILQWWPTNAIQGDKATWDMLFTLTSDP